MIYFKTVLWESPSGSYQVILPEQIVTITESESDLLRSATFEVDQHLTRNGLLKLL